MILKKRLGSKQVIAYKLQLEYLSDGGSYHRESIHLVAKKYADQKEGQQEFEMMKMLWKYGFGKGARLKIPKPIGYLSDLQLLVQKRAPGKQLSGYVSGHDSTTLDCMRMTASWLAKLHWAVPALALRAGIPMEDEVKLLQAHAAELSRRHPHLASRLDEVAIAVAESIASFEAVRLTIIHGDFHPENIFISQHRATVIDFERCCKSDPASDLGYFIAQMRLIAYRTTGMWSAADNQIRAFLQLYFAAVPLEEKQSLAARIGAYVSRSLMECLYYVACVVTDEKPDIIATGLAEAERFIRMDTI